MTACAIRYRLDGAGPAAFLVECEGRFHFYTRGELGAAVATEQVRSLLANRFPRWVPAIGDLALDGPRPAPGTPARLVAGGYRDDLVMPGGGYHGYGEAGAS